MPQSSHRNFNISPLLTRSASLPLLPSHSLGGKIKTSNPGNRRIYFQRETPSSRGNLHRDPTSRLHTDGQARVKKEKPLPAFQQEMAEVIKNKISYLMGLPESERFLGNSAKYVSILEGILKKYEQFFSNVSNLENMPGDSESMFNSIFNNFKKEVESYVDFVAAQLTLMKKYSDAIKTYKNLPIAKYSVNIFGGTSLDKFYENSLNRLRNIDTTREKDISLSTIEESSHQLEEFHLKIQQENKELLHSFHNQVIECLLKDAESAAIEEVHGYARHASSWPKDSLRQYFKKELGDPLSYLRQRLIATNNPDSTNIFLREIQLLKKRILKTLSENTRQTYLEEFARLGREVGSKRKNRPLVFGRGFGRGMINILRNIKYGFLYPFRANKKACYNKMYAHIQSSYQVLSQFSMDNLADLQLFTNQAEKWLGEVRQERRLNITKYPPPQPRS